MSRSAIAKRSLARRTGESAYGLLLLARNAALALIVLLLLVAGIWTSWETAPYAMLSGSWERGTLQVHACDSDACSGSFAPAGAEGGARQKMTITQAIGHQPGKTLDVAVLPGTNRAVRTGLSGSLYAWVPFAGSLLLASPVVAGGLRLRRTAWAMGLLGVVLMGASFVTL